VGRGEKKKTSTSIGPARRTHSVPAIAVRPRLLLRAWRPFMVASPVDGRSQAVPAVNGAAEQWQLADQMTLVS